MLYNRRMPLKLGRKILLPVWPTMIYDGETWGSTKKGVNRLYEYEMGMLIWMCGVTRNIRSKTTTLGAVGEANYSGKVIEMRLK